MDIKIENLVHTYMAGTPMEKNALHDVNLEFTSGSFVGLIGHTGSGKSTLIQHLNGLLKPTSGKIMVDGRNIAEKETDLKQLRFQVGLVFQYPEYQLFDETIGGDIAYGPKNMGLSEEEIQQRVKEAMEFVGLPESMKEKSPFEISGGQKRRVAIAGILAMRPKVLILDEPTAGLDPHGRDEMLENISFLHKERKMTILLVSHSMEDVARTCEKVVVMNHGTVAMQGSVKEVFSREKELTDIHLDVPQINRLIGRLNEMGYRLPKDIFTPEEATLYLLERIRENKESTLERNE